MCRELRLERGLKQREVADLIGVKTTTYGNTESSEYKVVNRKRAALIAEVYGLDHHRTTSLLEAWDRCPLSPFGEKRKDYWEKLNRIRNKAKNHDPLKFATVGLLGIVLMDRPDEQACSCAIDGSKCLVCYALERVGATSPFTPADRDKILGQLSKISAELMPAYVASEQLPPAVDDEVFGG